MSVAGNKGHHRYVFPNRPSATSQEDANDPSGFPAFYGDPSPPLPISTPGTGRGRSQAHSLELLSSPRITPSDSEFRADKQKQARCRQMCPAAIQADAAISGGALPLAPALSTRCPPSTPAFPGETRQRTRRVWEEKARLRAAPREKIQAGSLGHPSPEKEDETASVKTAALTLRRPLCRADS